MVECSATPSNESFSFTLDNLINETHPHIYFTCLLFYENLENFSKLKEKYESFESDYDKMSIVSNRERSSKLFKFSNKTIPHVNIKTTPSVSFKEEESEYIGRKKASIDSFKLDDECSVFTKATIANTSNLIFKLARYKN